MINSRLEAERLVVLAGPPSGGRAARSSLSHIRASVPDLSYTSSESISS